MRFKFEDTYVETIFKELTGETPEKYARKDLGLPLCRSIKKRYNELKAAPNFQTYLETGLGKPHPEKGDLHGKYGISVDAHNRLIVRPECNNLSTEELRKCEIVIIEGVMDYHGGKYEWKLP